MGLLDAIFTPNTLTANPEFKYDPEYIDPKTGEKVGRLVGTPYKQPDVWDKIFNQEGSKIASLSNAQTSNAKTMEEYQHGIQTGIATQDAAKIKPVLDKPITQWTAGQLATGTENHPSIANLYGLETYAQNLANKIPGVQALSSALNLSKANRGTQADLSNNLPEAESAARLSQAQFQTPHFKAEGQKIDSGLKFDLAKTASEQSLLDSDADRRRAVNQGIIDTAQSGTSARNAENRAAEYNAIRQTNNKDAYDRIASLIASKDILGAEKELEVAKAEGLLTPSVIETLQNQTAAARSQSIIHKGFGEQGVKDLSLDMGTMANQARMGRFHSNFGAMPPFAATTINPDNSMSVGATGFPSEDNIKMQQMLAGAKTDNTARPLVSKSTGAVYTPQPRYDETGQRIKAPITSISSGTNQTQNSAPAQTQPSSVDTAFKSSFAKASAEQKIEGMKVIAAELVKALGIPKELPALQYGSSSIYKNPEEALFEALTSGESHGFKGTEIGAAFEKLPVEKRAEIYQKALEKAHINSGNKLSPPVSGRLYIPPKSTSPWE